jgi:hypothetical protein
MDIVYNQNFILGKKHVPFFVSPVSGLCPIENLNLQSRCLFAVFNPDILQDHVLLCNSSALKTEGLFLKINRNPQFLTPIIQSR